MSLDTRPEGGDVRVEGVEVGAEGGDVRVEGVEVRAEGGDVRVEGVEVGAEGGDVRVEGVGVKAEGGEMRVKLEVRAQPAGEASSRLWERRRSSRTGKRARGSVRSERSVRGDGDPGEGVRSRHNSDSGSFYSFRAEYGLDQIALLSDSDVEYFDAKGTCKCRGHWSLYTTLPCPPCRVCE